MSLPRVGRRERYRWRRIALSAARTEVRAAQDWATHAQPAVEHIDRMITRAENRIAELQTEARFRHRWLAEHPELARRITHTRRELQRLHHPVGVELLEQVEAVMQEPAGTTPTRQRPRIARMQEHLDRLEHQRGIDPPALSV